MAATEELGAALGLTAEPTPPEPDEAPATYKAGKALFDTANAPAPVNAGKCAGDTDPNALQQAPLIEWIHFGYVHLSRANLFKHPTYPGDQGTSGRDAGDRLPGVGGGQPAAAGGGGDGVPVPRPVRDRRHEVRDHVRWPTDAARGGVR